MCHCSDFKCKSYRPHIQICNDDKILCHGNTLACQRDNMMMLLVLHIVWISYTTSMSVEVTINTVVERYNTRFSTNTACSSLIKKKMIKIVTVIFPDTLAMLMHFTWKLTMQVECSHNLLYTMCTQCTWILWQVKAQDND